METSDNNAHQKPFFDLPAWRYFITFYKDQYRLLLLNSMGSAAQSLIVLPSLLLIRYAFDEAIPQKNIYHIVLAGFGIFAFRLANSGVSLWLRAVNIRIISSAIHKLREDLLKKLYLFSRTFHTRSDQKTVHARIVQDTERLSNMSTALVSRLMPALFTSVALCILLMFLNWILVLIMVSLFPVLFYANRYTGKKVKNRVYVFQRAFEHFSKGMLFVLRYMDLTRIQTAEKEEMKKQNSILESLRDSTGRMAFIYAVHGQAQQTLAGFSGIIILIFGGASVALDYMTIGEFLSFYVAAAILISHIDTITESVAELISGNESMVTLHCLAETNDIQPYRGGKKIRFNGSITMESVFFSYDDHPVLKGINFRINRDSKIAVIGPNGAGKSTLTHLILGFYKPLQGMLYADNVPYDELDIVGLRKSIGVVMQNPLLFSGTVLENITYGREGPDRSQVMHACRFSLADEFIQGLPDGYDTQIGEDGTLLSGGECQRLAIARAIIHRPKLLILDEPTNHLDTQTVTRLMDSLDALTDPPAIVIISHDMSVVNHAREIYRLDKGMLSPYAAERAVR